MDLHIRLKLATGLDWLETSLHGDGAERYRRAAKEMFAIEVRLSSAALLDTTITESAFKTRLGDVTGFHVERRSRSSFHLDLGSAVSAAKAAT